MSKATFDFSLKNLFRRPNTKIEITTETKQTLKMQRTTRQYANVCNKCRIETVFLPLTEIANVFEMQIEFLEFFIREKNVHYFESNKSETLVCLKSLIAAMNNKIIDI